MQYARNQQKQHEFDIKSINPKIWKTLNRPIKGDLGFKLSISQLQIGIYFSIIVMLKKSYFTTSATQNFEQNTKKQVNSIYIIGIMFLR